MKILLPLIAFAVGNPLFAQTVSTSATPGAPAAAPTAAATAQPTFVPEIHAKSILETLFAAGWVMALLFALSVFFVMLVIIYLMTIRRGAVVSNRHGEAIARVVQKILDFTTKNPGADLAQVREIAETEGTRVASSLNNRVTYLADIGMIAPLLGLLGTVLGIIRSFGALGADLGTARYVLLSKGISEALVNTCAGLAIGIPAMMFYAYFRGKAQKLISELESATTHVLALLSLQHGGRTASGTERTPVLIEDEL